MFSLPDWLMMQLLCLVRSKLAFVFSSHFRGKTDDYSSKEKDSIKSAENLDSLLSNSVM